jgi:hypothetical protein
LLLVDQVDWLLVQLVNDGLDDAAPGAVAMRLPPLRA